jgi:hypothetical protein
MGDLAVQLLLNISTLLGVTSVPSSNLHWQTKSGWHQQNGFMHFEAESTTLANSCQGNPDLVIQFPQIIHGIHRLYANNKLLLESGDASFARASPFYYAPQISCNQISANDRLRWEVVSYTSYFARFQEFPKVSDATFLPFFSSISIYLLLSGFITSLALISFLIYSDKKKVPATQRYFIGALFLVGYMLCCVNTYINFNLSMLVMHKLADSFFWISVLLTFYFFLRNQLLNTRLFQIHTLFSVISILMILLGKSGDQVQLGTSLPFLSTLGCFGLISTNALKEYFNYGRLSKLFPIFVGTMSVIIFGINDMLGAVC